MIHILGLILKIIGWVLLWILGIFLGILLFVLFSAICYRIDGEKREALTGQVKLTWMLRILSVTVRYQKELSIRAAVFGHTVWQLGQKEEPGKRKGRRKKKRKKGMENDSELFGEDLEEAGSEDETAPQAAEGEGSGEDVSLAAGGEGSGEDMSLAAGGEGSEADASLTAGGESGKKENAKEKADMLSPEQEAKPGGPEAENAKQGKKKGAGSIREFFSQKIQQILSFFQKVRFSISSFCDKLKQAGEGIQDLQEKWEKLTAFLQDPGNQKSAKLIFRQAKKALVYLFPRKGRGELTLGLEDPYLLGQVLSAASLGYPWLHKVFVFHPVFDQKVFEGEVHVRGHIRIGVLLWYVLRLLFDGNIRRRLWKLIRH